MGKSVTPSQFVVVIDRLEEARCPKQPILLGYQKFKDFLAQDTFFGRHFVLRVR
jgi:hypothetical protein